MKKLLVLMLVLLLLVCFIACASTEETTALPEITEPSYPEYIGEEEGRLYLILPLSKKRIWIEESEKPHIEKIDLATLTAAEEGLNAQIAQYEETPGLYFRVVEGCLYLYAEIIVEYDPIELPGGYFGSDHEHLFFKEKLTD